MLCEDNGGGADTFFEARLSVLDFDAGKKVSACARWEATDIGMGMAVRRRRAKSEDLGRERCGGGDSGAIRGGKGIGVLEGPEWSTPEGKIGIDIQLLLMLLTKTGTAVKCHANSFRHATRARLGNPLKIRKAV